MVLCIEDILATRSASSKSAGSFQGLTMSGIHPVDWIIVTPRKVDILQVTNQLNEVWMSGSRIVQEPLMASSTAIRLSSTVP